MTNQGPNIASTGTPRFGYYIIRVLPKGTPLSEFFLAAVDDARFADFSKAYDALYRVKETPIPLINGFFLLACLPKTTAVWRPDDELNSCKTAFIAKSIDVESSMRLMIPMNHALSKDLVQLMEPGGRTGPTGRNQRRKIQNHGQPNSQQGALEEDRLEEALEQKAAEALCLLGSITGTGEASTSREVKRKRTSSFL